jgi:hypothetical protein
MSFKSAATYVKKRIGSLGGALCLLASLLPLEACTTGRADTQQLAPHRATYSVKLGQAAQGGGVVGVRGSMSMTFEKSCEGWVMQQQMSMAMQTSEGKVIDQDTRYGGLESYDGLRYRFGSFTRSEDDKSNYRGDATRSKDGKKGQARYTDPEAETFELPPDTLFPASHTMLMIEEARKGTKLLVRPLFDGTEGKGAEQVSTFIGPMQTPDKFKPRLKVDSPLLDHPGWPIRMAVFEIGKNDPSPDYEMGFLQLDNGLTPTLEIDYPDFKLIFELQKLEPLPAPHC